MLFEFEVKNTNSGYNMTGRIYICDYHKTRFYKIFIIVK